MVKEWATSEDKQMTSQMSAKIKIIIIITINCRKSLSVSPNQYFSAFYFVKIVFGGLWLWLRWSFKRSDVGRQKDKHQGINSNPWR